MEASSRPSPSLSERTEVGDLFPLVEELGVGLDQPDELLAADRELLRVLPRILGDQLHDVVVVDECGGEEDELEVELVDIEVGGLAVLSGRTLLLLKSLGGFEIGGRGRRGGRPRGGPAQSARAARR